MVYSDREQARQALARGAKDIAIALFLLESNEKDAIKRGELHLLELERAKLVNKIHSYI